jgi:hypothetical protein
VSNVRAITLAGVAVSYALLCGTLIPNHPLVGAAAAVAPAAALAVTRIQVQRETMLFAAWIGLLVTANPWRNQAANAIGQTTAADSRWKIVATLAFAILAWIYRDRGAKITRAQLLLLGYVACATIGSLALGVGVNAGLSRPARFALMVLAAIWIAESVGSRAMARWTMVYGSAIGLLALAGRFSGLEAPYGTRLQGFLLPMHPNALAAVVALGLLCAFGLWAEETVEGRKLITTLVVAVPVLILAGSRTTLVATILAVAIVLGAQTFTRRGPAIAFLLATAIVCALFAQSATGYRPITHLASRGSHQATDATLYTRQHEFDEVKASNSSVTRELFGQGLQAKTVKGQFGSYYIQVPVDGTWSSAYLSAGVVGLGLLAWVLLAGIGGAFRRRDQLALLLGVYLLVASITSNILNDITPGLIVLVAVVLASKHDYSNATSPSRTT